MGTTGAGTIGAGAGGARERILDSAYELFAKNGIQAVGIEAVLAHSGVARQTLYRHFDSKQDLVLAFLERREEVWTKEWLQAEVERRETEPAARLLVIFDVFDEWFQVPDFEGCTFINVMLEHPDGRTRSTRRGSPTWPRSGSSSRSSRRQRGFPTLTTSRANGTS